MRQIARFNNDINSLKINQENLGHQREKLVIRQAQVETQRAELAARVAGLEEQKNTLAEQSATLKEQAETVRGEQQATSQKQAQISQELARQREQRSGLLSRRNVLQDLMNKREGVSQTLRELLKQRDAGQGFAYVRGIVADVLSAELSDAPLIEAALGDLQHAVVVQDAAALVGDAGLWQKLAGRVSVLPLDRLPPFQDGYDWSLQERPVRRAIDLVRYDESHSALVHHLLGRTVLVETLSDALELAERGPRGYRFVTRAGEVLEPGGTLHMGDLSQRTGIISRRAEVAALEEQLAAIEIVIADLTAQIAQCDAHGRQLDARQQELRSQLYQTDNARAEAAAGWQQASSQLQRTSSEAPLIAGEIESIDRQVATAKQRQGECEQRVADLEAQSRQVEAVIHERGAQVIVRQHEVAELSEAATRARVAMGQVQEQRSSLSRALATARQNVAHTQVEIQRVAGETQTAESRLAEAHRTIDATRQTLGEMAQRAAAAEAALAEATERIGILRSEHTEAGGQIDELQAQGEGLARQEHELSLAKNELSVRIETLIEHTQDELGINLVENFTTYQAQSMDWEAVAAEINELKGKIGRLGNVNLDAINEQSALEERQTFLHAQLADVAEAKRQLEELIGKINEDSKVRFVETFEIVRAEFQDMLRKLFGGGKADLVLENPEDVLESGIEILAKPPGKELQSMTLLSGGEKTMTAVALVMSIFKSKPSPFCILDEVDAALDESNTARFASIIEEFLNFSQFIVITHNKRSMSVANVLYGVTMQEQGVSKRVAVKFDQKGGGAPIVSPKSEEASAAA
jgi:chromosome segregation protein